MSRVVESRNALSELPINFAGTGDNIVIPGVAGRSARVYHIFFVVSAATNITIKRGSTAFTGAMPFTANGSMVLDFDEQPWFMTLDGEDFVISQSGTAQVSGQVGFTQIPTST